MGVAGVGRGTALTRPPSTGTGEGVGARSGSAGPDGWPLTARPSRLPAVPQPPASAATSSTAGGRGHGASAAPYVVRAHGTSGRRSAQPRPGLRRQRVLVLLHPPGALGAEHRLEVGPRLAAVPRLPEPADRSPRPRRSRPRPRRRRSSTTSSRRRPRPGSPPRRRRRWPARTRPGHRRPGRASRSSRSVIVDAADAGSGAGPEGLAATTRRGGRRGARAAVGAGVTPGEEQPPRTSAASAPTTGRRRPPRTLSPSSCSSAPRRCRSRRAGATRAGPPS